MGGRCAKGGAAASGARAGAVVEAAAPAASGNQPSTLAYTAKNEETLRSVARNLRATSVTPSLEKRVGSHGGELTIKYQRTASAPSRSRSSHGLTVFPLCLDIF